MSHAYMLYPVATLAADLPNENDDIYLESSGKMDKFENFITLIKKAMSENKNRSFQLF